MSAWLGGQLDVLEKIPPHLRTVIEHAFADIFSPANLDLLCFHAAGLGSGALRNKSSSHDSGSEKHARAACTFCASKCFKKPRTPGYFFSPSTISRRCSGSSSAHGTSSREIPPGAAEALHFRGPAWRSIWAGGPWARLHPHSTSSMLSGDHHDRGQHPMVVAKNPGRRGHASEGMIKTRTAAGSGSLIPNPRNSCTQNVVRNAVCW